MDPHSRFGTSTWSSLIAAAADATLDVQWDSVTITADSPRGRMIAATLHGGAKSRVLRQAVSSLGAQNSNERCSLFLTQRILIISTSLGFLFAV